MRARYRRRASESHREAADETRAVGRSSRRADRRNGHELTTEPLDPNGGPIQLADYALHNEDGERIGLLEVTSITDEVAEDFSAAVAAGHGVWQDSQLRRNWLVSVRDAHVVVKRVKEAVTPALRDLESAGIEFACADPLKYVPPVTALTSRALEGGVVEVHALPERDEQLGFVFVNVMPSGNAYGINSLTVEVEAEASKADNRRKLSGELPRRELFIWANPGPDKRAASVLTTFGDAPHRDNVATARPPALPDEITAVWAAVWPRPSDSTLAIALWRGDRSGWEVLPPPLRGDS